MLSCGFYRFLERQQIILPFRILRYNDVLHIHDQQRSVVLGFLHGLHAPIGLINIKWRVLILSLILNGDFSCCQC
ncbi:hypothetical protein D3C81_1763050 [compost metagenome]